MNVVSKASTSAGRWYHKHTRKNGATAANGATSANGAPAATYSETGEPKLSEADGRGNVETTGPATV
jgi:hypothetical protein